MDARRVRLVCAALALIAATSVSISFSSTDQVQGAAIQSFNIGGEYAPAVRLNPPRVTGSVFVLGDSLMVGVVDSRYLIGPSLVQVLEGAGVTTWTSVSVARTIPQATAVLASFRLQIAAADTIVIGLGTNDIYNSGRTDVAGWRASITTLLNAIAATNSTAKIVWVDVEFPRVADRATAFNGLLGEFEAGGRVHVCPWQSYVQQHPEWVAGDGIHLNGAGYAARRDMILSCIGPI